MYSITEENLKWAYKKFKSYVYYNSSPRYLKKMVFDFEKNLSANETSFKKLEEKLKGILTKKTYTLLENVKINKLIYPKKDQVQFGDNNQIVVNEFNIFIDMPIELFLVDVLFAFTLLAKFKEFGLNDKDVYGSIFDERLYEVEEPLNNNLIFKNYHVAYKEWKNSALNKLEESSDKDRYLIKMDLKRCFYNIKFNFNQFLIEYNLNKNDPVIKIMREVYLLYSYKFCVEEGLEKGTYNAILPIGLVSSFPILNILLNALDRQVKALPGVISYSRYVDDILIIFDSYYINNKSNLELTDFLNDIIKDKTSIKSLDLIIKDIPINTNKQYIKLYKRGISTGILRKNYKDMFRTSLVDEDSMDEECDENEADDIGLSVSLIRKQIRNFNNGRINEANEVLRLIDSLNDVELINCFTIWDEIFEFIHKNESQDEYLGLFQKIKNIIENCEISPEREIGLKRLSFYLRKALNIEISIIKDLIGKDAQSIYYLSSIEQKDIISHIKNEEKCGALNYFFPVDVSIEEVQFYLSTKNTEWETFQEESNKLFLKINGYELKKDHPFNDIIVKSENLSGRRIVHITKKDSSNFAEVEANVNVAVVGLNMDGIEDSDFAHTYPSHYSYKEIIRLVYESSKNKAKYVLFPEFTLLEEHVFDLVKTCKKLSISIVIGLAHIFEKCGAKNTAKNFTLIYDNIMGVAIIREKNYLPPKEKFLIAKHGYSYIEKAIPEYVIFHNELMTYSSMTCYETTSIIDRALLSNRIEVLFLPVYNEDTNYFSNIVYSFSRDASCFIAQSNHNEFGDSRITAPMKQLFSDIVKIKGGDNNYSVVGQIKLKELRESLEAFDSKLEELDVRAFSNYDEIKNLEKEFNKIKEKRFKPLSAGIDISQREKNL